MSVPAPLRIAVAGASGRMGGELARLLASDAEHYRLTAAWVGTGSSALGRDMGELAGIGVMGVACSANGDTNAEVDAVMDFSTVTATPAVARAAEARGAALISGVTGLDAAAHAALAEAARRVPVLHTDNFSLGVAVLKELAVLACERLGSGFDIEISEAHHRGKRDAPSGTARMLGRALGDEQGRIRTGARDGSEIGYSVRRGGNVIGEHTVSFLGPHERLELTHRAEDRSLFASGALFAARWLVTQPPGQYTLEDSIARDGD
ncbi:MAG: 4-hydroxy-tetrahydrodipicolinate reductase [Gammaproteobacteria bacterium]